VAVKVLSPQMAATSPARKRFLREARSSAAVRHNNVVQVHEVEEKPLPYLVMEFISGETLQQRLDRVGPLEVPEVLEIGLQIAEGLAAAHATGLIHRDIKPGNILLTAGLRTGVKIADFGLARAVDDASLTQSGVVTGTPQYMSPEQARGEPIDHRSDLFSLGSVLYFMCTGHSPFRASSTPAVLRRVSDERPRPIREVHRDVPEWLAAIIDKLHEKDPARRFQSATEVADTLERHLSDLQRGVPITVHRIVPDGPVRHQRGRKPMIVAALIIPFVALAVAAFENPNAISPLIPAMTRPAPAGANDRAAGNGADDNVIVVMADDANQRIVGSGTLAAKSWDVAGFDRVQVRSAFRAEIIKGTGFKVTATADDNVIPHIKVTKEGTTLKISLERGSYRLKSPLKAEITLPSLIGIDIDGASKGTLKGFQSERELSLKITGSSELAGGITVEKGDFKVDGASTLSLVGSAQAAHLSAEGASHLKLKEFLLKSGLVDLEGASTAEITVKSEALFKAKLSGASTLKGSIQAKEIDLDLDGASQATLAGAVNDAKIRILSASSLKMPGLVLQNADVTLSEAGHATVDIRGKLKYELNSASSLRYLGEPTTLDGSKSGGSSIARGR
jgi:eukaryotic-like serine/threonine-protein kinase